MYERRRPRGKSEMEAASLLWIIQLCWDGCCDKRKHRDYGGSKEKLSPALGLKEGFLKGVMPSGISKRPTVYEERVRGLGARG